MASRRYPLAVLMVLIPFGLCALQSPAPIATEKAIEAWFREYAGVWRQLGVGDVSKVYEFYSFPYYSVPLDGSEPRLFRSSKEAEDSLREFLQSEGDFTGSELTRLEVEPSSSQAAFVVAEWRSYDANRVLGDECAGRRYLVAIVESEWKILGFAAQLCAQ